MDKEYLSMVLALPDEIFENWKWEAGDKGLIISEKREVIMLGQTGQLIWYYDRGDLLFNPEYVKNDIAAIEINYIRPYPNQEQLQELIQNCWLKLDPTVQSYGVVKYFCNWFHANWVSYPAYKEVETESINSIWLRYTMWMIYKKEWNGDSWI